MGRSSRGQVRQQSEWVEGAPRRISQPRRIPDVSSQADRSRPTLIYPHLSVVRYPNINDTPTLHQWREMLDDLGVRNRPKGTARALGSAVISLIMGREMNVLLRDTYPEDAAQINSMRKLQHKVGKGITQFLGREYEANYVTSLEKAADEHYSKREQVDDFDNDRRVWEQMDSADIYIHPKKALALKEHKFGPSTFETPRKGALQPFGRGHGIDLTTVDQLHQERQELARYLRKEHSLNVNLLDSEWTPHAVVFDYLDHIAVADIDRTVTVPRTITFSAPQVLNS